MFRASPYPRRVGSRETPITTMPRGKKKSRRGSGGSGPASVIVCPSAQGKSVREAHHVTSRRPSLGMVTFNRYRPSPLGWHATGGPLKIAERGGGGNRRKRQPAPARPSGRP